MIRCSIAATDYATTNHKELDGPDFESPKG